MCNNEGKSKYKPQRKFMIFYVNSNSISENAGKYKCAYENI